MLRQQIEYTLIYMFYIFYLIKKHIINFLNLS